MPRFYTNFLCFPGAPGGETSLDILKIRVYGSKCHLCQTIILTVVCTLFLFLFSICIQYISVTSILSVVTYSLDDKTLSQAQLCWIYRIVLTFYFYLRDMSVFKNVSLLQEEERKLLLLSTFLTTEINSQIAEFLCGRYCL